MNCADFEPLLALQAGGDLSDRESGRLADHLAHCDACRVFAAAMAADLDWLHRLHQEPADRAALHTVRTAVMRQLEHKRSRWRGPWLPLPWKWQTVAVAVLAAILLGGIATIDFWRHSQPGVVQEQQQVTRKAAEPAPPTIPVARSGPDQNRPATAPANAPAAGSARKPKTKPSRRRAMENEAAPVQLVHVDLEPKPGEPASEAVMVKIPTRNPDIVVYWLMDDSNQGDGL